MRPMTFQMSWAFVWSEVTAMCVEWCLVLQAVRELQQGDYNTLAVTDVLLIRVDTVPYAPRSGQNTALVL